MISTELTSGYADVNGVRLHYVASGIGPLILFLHGFPEFWYAWKGQIEAFGRERRAAAVDLRGYNLSSGPSGVDAYGMPHLVEDIRQLWERLGPEPFVLVGHDWGGVIAWSFAAMYPERLSHLVIVNAPHPSLIQRELKQNPAQRRASRYMLLFQTPLAEALLSAGRFAFLRRGLRHGCFPAEDQAAYIRAWSQPGALTAALNYYRAAHLGALLTGRGPSTIPSIGVISVPSLVLWGERDPYLLSGNLEGLQELIPRGQIRRVTDASHWIVHERPSLVNDAIRQFIGASTPPG